MISTDTHGRDLLSAMEAEKIAGTRRNLKELQRQIRNRMDQKALPDGCDPFYVGKLDEAIEVAEDALFNVLNTASSFCQSGEAKAAILRDRA